MKGLFKISLAIALLFCADAFAQTAEDEAGDVSEVDKDRTGPLKDRVRPVSGHLFLKRGRFELSPSVGISVRDAFFTKYVLGVALTYHPVETVGVSLRGGYALNAVSGAAQICITQVTGSNTTRGCNPPTYDQVNGRAPGQITLIGGLDLQWAPIYGKVALMAQNFAHFDMYGLAGPAFVQYLGPSGTGSTSMSTVGGNLGLGMRFVANRFITVRTEVRDLIYSETVVGGGGQLRNQFFFELGLSFFLPTSFQEG